MPIFVYKHYIKRGTKGDKNCRLPRFLYIAFFFLSSHICKYEKFSFSFYFFFFQNFIFTSLPASDVRLYSHYFFSSSLPARLLLFWFYPFREIKGPCKEKKKFMSRNGVHVRLLPHSDDFPIFSFVCCYEKS